MKTKVFTASDIKLILERENTMSSKLHAKHDDGDYDEEDDDYIPASTNSKPFKKGQPKKPAGKWNIMPIAGNNDITKPIKISLTEIEKLFQEQMEKFKMANQTLTNTNTNMEKAKVEEIIKNLKLVFDCQHFIITGSVALAKYGLLSWDKVNDIDILLVSPTEVAKEMALKFMEQQPAKAKPKEKTKDSLGLFSIFIWQGVKVDIFISKGEDFLEIDGNKYATIPHIVQAKTVCNRLKDWISLRNIARQFFIESNFQSYLNNNPVFTNNQEEYV